MLARDKARLDAYAAELASTGGDDQEWANVTAINVLGARHPPHRHSGPCFGYVLAGEMVFEVEGEPAHAVRAGEAFWEPGGDVIHYQNGNNRDDIPVRYTVTMLCEPGKPMLTLVDEEGLSRRKDRRVPGHAEDADPLGGYLHHEQHIQPLEEDRVHGEEAARQQPLSLGTQEARPGSIQAARSGPKAPSAQEPPYGRLTDLIASRAGAGVQRPGFCFPAG